MNACDTCDSSFEVAHNGLNPYQRLLKKARLECIPISAIYELTYRCNWNCVHCYLDHRAARNELTTPEAVDMLDQLVEAGTLYLTLTGGEPMLRPNFFEIAEEARRRYFSLKIFTTGAFIDHDAARRIANLGCVEVEMSLLGNRDTHIQIAKNKKSFEQVVRATKNLREFGVSVLLKNTLMYLNENEVEEVQQIARDLDCEVSIFTSLVPKDNGDPSPTKLTAHRQQIVDHALRMMSESADGSLPFVDDEYEEGVDLNMPQCGTARDAIAIGPEGDIYPCLQMKKAAGNIRTGRIAEVWKSSEWLRTIRNFKRSDNSKCVSCGDKNYCAMCPAVALMTTGKLSGDYPDACEGASVRHEIHQKFYQIQRKGVA